MRDEDVIVRLERAVMSVLQPLTGTRSTGSVLVKALGVDTPMPLGSYGVPAPVSAAGNAALDYRRLVKTRETTTVTAAGVLVPLMTVTGGPRQVLEGGTKIQWDPPIPGIEPVSTLAAAGLTGGTAPAEAIGSITQVTVLEGLGKENYAKSLWTAGLGEGAFPAVVIAWEGASPGAARGVSKNLRRHQFKILVAVSRVDGDDPRRDEGKRLLAAVEREIGDRSEVDGEVFSAPNTDLGPAGRLVLSPEVYVYWMDFFVQRATLRRDRRTYAAWRTSQQQITTVPDEAHPPGEELVLVDQEQDMPQD
jgi:hypothetical protein